MAKLSSFRSDLVKEKEGTWAKFPGSDAEFLIARFGQADFELACRKLRKSALRAATGELSEREARDALAPAYAEHILLGWKNLDDDDGKPLGYSKTAAIEVLKNPEYNDLYTWITGVAQSSERYKIQQDEDEQGN